MLTMTFGHQVRAMRRTRRCTDSTSQSYGDGGRLKHDHKPGAHEVYRKGGRRGYLYPTKSRADQKIDAAVALMIAMGRAMVEDEQAGFLTNPIFG
jgi:hypothetical protein